MILSIVIVNFNVRYFLEQCLHAVEKAISGTPILVDKTEVIIVDNASTDGSVDYLKPLFPSFHFIANTGNPGFARANNQVLPRCSGKYILFLNPDTVLAEDCLGVCISFFEQHADAGALGVRMIDGCGRFLKESKRGFPSASASFFKMSGLARVFPSSRRLAAYYAGHLNPSGDHPVEVLSGAFMMLRKNVLDAIGGFDEQFFMYAEDIDLSYRILQAGYRNYYLAQTTIIHFKGESTARDTRYVRQFHLAMRQFIRKYARHKSFAFAPSFLHLGISLKQAMAAVPLYFRTGRESAKTAGPIFIEGTVDLPGVKTALLAAGVAVTEKPAAAGAWLFCEGGEQSFKTIIAAMDRRPVKIPCFIHGAGTGSAVGGGPGALRGRPLFFLTRRE